MLWTRDEYLSHMTFHGSPREMFCELFGPLKMLEDQWRAAGAQQDELSLKAFGFDGVQYAHVPAKVGAITGLTPKIISDTETDTFTVDAMGRTMRLCKTSATIALPVSYPVSTPADWEKIKHWYTFQEDRVDIAALQALRKAQKEGTLIIGSLPGGFDEPRQLMGEENLCYALYDEPEMIGDMLSTMADTCKKVYERVCDYVTVDVLHVHEDMAGKSGPLLGSNLVEAFIKPYYLSVWEPLKAHGAQLFSQDSDGNMTAVIDVFLESGINCMYPMEPMAGMDMLALRKKYGTRLAFKGGIDKFALRNGRQAIEKELTYKLQAPLTGGGTVFGLDHRIPNGVPLEDYYYYVDLARELLALPKRQPAEHLRMAF